MRADRALVDLNSLQFHYANLPYAAGSGPGPKLRPAQLAGTAGSGRETYGPDATGLTRGDGEPADLDPAAEPGADHETAL